MTLVQTQVEFQVLLRLRVVRLVMDLGMAEQDRASLVQVVAQDLL